MTQRERRRRVGQLVVAGFAAEVIPVELRAVAREFDIGGIVLAARNVAEPAQVADLAREAQGLSRTAPAWVAMARQGPSGQPIEALLTRWPSVASLGRADDPALTRRFGRALAREMRAMGLTFGLLPVLDVRGPRGDAAIGECTLSDDPAVVSRHGVALIEALHAEGLPACARHFPGCGAASAGSPGDLPIADLPPDRFERVEWIPFAAAIEAGVDAVMTGHLLAPSLDEQQPATVSHAVTTTRLRGQLGFDGVVVSDDMDAPALAARFEPGEAAALAVAAGCDVLLHGGTDAERVFAALEGIVRALEDESLPAARVDAALRRHLALKGRYLSDDALRRAPAPPALRDVIGSAEHAAVAEQMRQFA